MNSYNVKVYYDAGIFVDVKAENEEQAIDKALKYCDNLSSSNWLEEAEPVIVEIETIEIKGDN